MACGGRRLRLGRACACERAVLYACQWRQNSAKSRWDRGSRRFPEVDFARDFFHNWINLRSPSRQTSRWSRPQISYRQAGWWIEYLLRRMEALSCGAWHLASVNSELPTQRDYHLAGTYSIRIDVAGQSSRSPAAPTRTEHERPQNTPHRPFSRSTNATIPVLGGLLSCVLPWLFAVVLFILVVNVIVRLRSSNDQRETSVRFPRMWIRIQQHPACSRDCKNGWCARIISYTLSLNAKAFQLLN